MHREHRIVVVAGEPSGDRIAARAVAAIAAELPAASFIGIGGDAMEAAGVTLCAHVRSFCALGIGDSLRSLPAWMNAYASLRLACRREPPCAALLVDCPEVNLRLGRAFRQEGIPVLQYVAPKVWAWRRTRLRTLADRMDALALVLPFEEEIFLPTGVPVQFVGHPLVEDEPGQGAEARRALHLTADVPVAALLPGSRPSEVQRMGPLLIDVGASLRRQGVVPVLAPAPGAASPDLEETARAMGCCVFRERARDLLAAADVALAASGTVTLEAALEETPMVICYRVDALSALIARRYLRVPFVGLPNWVAGRQVVPELLQEMATVPALLKETRRLLQPEEADAQRTALREVRRRLGPTGASAGVARMLKKLAGW